jgi:hypothetical protein
MDILLTAFALLLPVLMGIAWLNVLVPAEVPARPALVMGTGCLLGLLLLPQLMRLLSGVGLGLDFATTVAAIGVLTVLPLIGHRWRRAGAGGAAVPSVRLSPAQSLLCALLLALIGLRLVGLGMEVSWRPLFPWDATMHWATKARVWFEHGDMVPFIGPGQWLEIGGEGAYTDRHFDYPVTIPLLQVWMNLATGQWNESLMNLPWILCMAGLGAAFYGQLRLSGLDVTIATVFSYFLLSLPLLNSHVALAGYADLFLGATYCCALMALHNWTVHRKAWLAVLTLAFAAFGPLVKNEGIIWSLTLLPAVLTSFIGRRQTAEILLLVILGGILMALVLPPDMVIAGHRLSSLTPEFNAEAIPWLITSILLHDSWHLLGYMMLILLPLGIVMPGAMLRSYLGLSTALGCAVAGFLYLFLFTGFSWGAVNFTATGRLELQLAPALLFLCALIFDDLCRRENILAPARQRP